MARSLPRLRRNRGGYVRLFLVTLVGGLGVFGVGFGLVWLAQSAMGQAPEYQHVLAIATILVAVTVGPYLQFVLYHVNGQMYARAMR